MIAATFNCGCPTTKKPSLIIEPIGLQASYSSCGFRHSGALHHQRRQRAQRYFQFGKSKHAYLSSKDKVSCCKNFCCAPTRPERIPSGYKSSILPQYSNYRAMHATKMQSAPSRRRISAVICASTENIDKQYLRSKNKSKLKKHKIEQTPTKKIVSEIVKKGQPYKEIEAIFNDNRVVIRTQKEPIEEEYDPPCECIGQDTAAKESTSSLKKCDDGVVFEMPTGNLELCRTPRAEASLIKKTCDQEGTGCRTMSLYPNIKNDYIPTSVNERVKKSNIQNKQKSLNLEENPNIFVLRIRNHSSNNDKKQKIDFEFRAPRPWRPKKDEKKKSQLSKDLEKCEENIHNHIKNDISEKLEKHKEDINNKI